MAAETHDNAAPPATGPLDPSAGQGGLFRGWSSAAVGWLLAICVIALVARVYRMPPESAQFPGRLEYPADPDEFVARFDPPSMDEHWHLALTTGHGSPLEANRFPPGRLVRDVPPMTSLDGAAPWWRVWTSLDRVLHPPLYVQTLRFWRAAFGDSDTAALAYSFAWSVVCIVFTFAALRLAAGTAPAVYAGLLLALSPTEMYIAQEIRGYAMLCGLSAMLVAVLVVSHLRGLTLARLAAACGLMLALMLTHYFAAFGCLAAAAMLLVLAGRPVRRWQVLAGLAATAAVYLVVWGPFFKRQLGAVETGDSWLAAVVPGAWPVIRHTAMLPLRFVREDNYLAAAWVPVAFGVLLATALAAAVFRPLRGFAVWAFATMACLAAMDVARGTRHISFIRYAIAGAPAMLALMTAAPLALPRATALGRQVLVHVVGLTLLLYGFAHWNALLRLDSPNALPVAIFGSPMLAGGDVLVVAARGEYRNYDEAIVLAFGHLPGVFPRDVVVLRDPMTDDLRRELAGRVAVLMEVNRDDPPEALIPGGALARRPVQFAPNFRVVPLRVTAPENAAAPATQPAR
jgi:hypothetical protein